MPSPSLDDRQGTDTIQRSGASGKSTPDEEAGGRGGRFRQIGMGVEMDQRERTMFFGVRLECWIGRKIQTKRGHVLSTSFDTVSSTASIISSRSSGGRRDVNG